MRQSIIQSAMLYAATGVCALALAGCNKNSVEATNEKPSAVASKVAEAAGSGSVQFTPGRWETEVKVVKMDMDGVPPEAKRMMEQMMGKGRTVSSCLTKEEAEKPNGKFFGQADKNCTYDHFTMGNGSIDSKLTCKTPQGSQVMTMNGSFTGTTYNTTMHMQGQGPMGKVMNMTMELAARRVGDCTGKEDG